MARLIDADALEPSEVYMNYGFTRIVYMDDIDEMPTIDAVQVVRCKDCKYYEGDYSYCAIKRYATPDDYCSAGRKKQREDEVVRCKDCKFNYANQIPSGDECQLCVELPISKDFFCAYGEKLDKEMIE